MECWGNGLMLVARHWLLDQDTSIEHPAALHHSSIICATDMKVNLRWLVQAISLMLGIYLFMRLFDTSKALILFYSTNALLAWLALFLLFAVCFFLLLFTSYLKQRGNNTLKKRIAVFERMVVFFGLSDFSERNEIAQGKRKPCSAAAAKKVSDSPVDNIA